MSLKISSPLALLNIIELVLSLIVAGLIAGEGCVAKSIMKAQFIAGIVYGYLIIHAVFSFAIVIPGQIEKNFRLLWSGCGSILHLAAAALILEAADTAVVGCSLAEHYDRSVAAGVLGLAIFISEALDTYFVYRHMET